MQMDSGIFSNLFQNIPLKPYAGFALGAMQYENDKGYLYGVDGGLTYFLNDEIDIDLGYRFMTTSKVLTVDSIKDLTLSLHYFY
jgi:opacity protein-like surface antigen